MQIVLASNLISLLVYVDFYTFILNGVYISFGYWHLKLNTFTHIFTVIGTALATLV